MQVDTQEKVLMSKEELYNKIVTLTGGRSAEEVVFNLVTSGASNDIEQATKLARAMITRFGMTDEFDMVALETVNNAYLSGDTSLSCAPETAAKIDEAVFAVVKKAHKQARAILEARREKMDELAQYLLKKETITGDEFMAILHGTMKQDEPETVETTATSAEPEKCDSGIKKNRERNCGKDPWLPALRHLLKLPSAIAGEGVWNVFSHSFFDFCLFYGIMNILQSYTFSRNRMRIMETRTKPWKQGKSIFDYIKSNLDAEGFFTKENLEDRAIVAGDNEALLEPGAADAFLASNSQAEEAAGSVGIQIYQVLQAYAEDPTPENATMLYMGISSTPCILYYESLVDQLSEQRIPQPLWELAREWLYEASSRETVKLAIVICGLYMLNEQDLVVNWQLKKDLLVLARCEEFTSFVIYALELCHQLDQKDLWDMLQHTMGWGKLCAMQAYQFEKPGGSGLAGGPWL